MRHGARGPRTRSASTRRASAAYRFFWNDLCDWYLELAKPVLRKRDDGTYPRPAEVDETRATLAYVLEGSCACCTR